MYFEQFTTPGLGCFSYLIGCPLAGVAAVVDPKRDIADYLRQARAHGLRITHIFETHVHADHVSGARDLGRATGADICIHESAPVGYPARKLRHGEEFAFGAALLRVLHTPGHTPDSISLLVTDTERSPEPQLLLSGDLLFVGEVGRPDLPGAEILPEQLRNLYNSLHVALGGLPDGLEVYPAHGQGSLCGSGLSAKPHSTLGYERSANRRLRHRDFAEFSRSVMSDLPMRPQSFASISAANLEGPALLPPDDQEKKNLGPKELRSLVEQGALPLDLRDSLSFAAAHIPGSLHVDATQSQAVNWIGAVVPPKSRLVLILGDDGDFPRQRAMLRRIGHDDVAGYLEGGMAAWVGRGLPLASLAVLSAEALLRGLEGEHPPLVLDVRSRAEFDNYHIPGSTHLPFERLLRDDSCPVGPGERVAVCQSGYRSAIAAALLQARGCPLAGFLAGGVGSFKKLNGDGRAATPGR